LPGLPARPPEQDGPHDRLDLERAIAKLPDGCRTAFVLHDVEGFEHHEIATMLGISEGTSKSQVHKARVKLRRMLKAGTETGEWRRAVGAQAGHL
jgi:RNA polymerase sigma-70 factor (ECF subfamily)